MTGRRENRALIKKSDVGVYAAAKHPEDCREPIELSVPKTIGESPTIENNFVKSAKSALTTVKKKRETKNTEKKEGERRRRGRRGGRGRERGEGGGKAQGKEGEGRLPPRWRHPREEKMRQGLEREALVKERASRSDYLHAKS